MEKDQFEVAQIHETVTGCDFAVLPQGIQEVDEQTGDHIRKMGM